MGTPPRRRQPDPLRHPRHRTPRPPNRRLDHPRRRYPHHHDLALVQGPISLLVLLSVLVGVVRGNLTLLQTTAVTDRWGTTRYGRLSALLTAPATIAAALAPWAGAALTDLLGGYGGLFLALSGTSFVAAVLAMRTTPRGKAGSTGA